MKYLLGFNEKLGINPELEKQVNSYYDEINDPDNKNIFLFPLFYENDNGTHFFMLQITENLPANNRGRFSTNVDYRFKRSPNSIQYYTTIYLRDRNDKSTLLHEVKHLDYHTRKGMNNTYFNISNKAAVNKMSVYTIQLFYIFDENEFQSKFHSYYQECDDFIKLIVKDKPTTKDIRLMFQASLNSSDDDTWRLYMSDESFNFYNYDSKDNVDQVMLFIANKFQIKNITIDKSFLQKVKDGFKKLIGKKYSKEEMYKIKVVKEQFEKDINIRIKKYRRKMYRIVTLMCDKYVKT